MIISGVIFSLNDIAAIPYVDIIWRLLHDLPERDLVAYQLPGGGSKLVSADYVSKPIRIKGVIGAPSRALYEVARDTLVQKLQTPSAVLDIPYANTTRRFYATLTNIQFSNDGGGGADFVMEFVAHNPYGHDTAATTNTLATITSGATNLNYTFGGTFTARPTLTLTIGSITDGVGKTMTIGSPASGQTAIIARDFAAGDVIVINSHLERITVNGVLFPHAGVCPTFAPGAASVIAYTDTFGARSIVPQISYTKRYV